MPKSAVSRNINQFTIPSSADSITVEYPSENVEVYKYRKGGVSGTVLKTVTITYTANDKCDIDNVVVS